MNYDPNKDPRHFQPATTKTVEETKITSMSSSGWQAFSSLLPAAKADARKTVTIFSALLLVSVVAYFAYRLGCAECTSACPNSNKSLIPKIFNPFS